MLAGAAGVCAVRREVRGSSMGAAAAAHDAPARPAATLGARGRRRLVQVLIMFVAACVALAMRSCLSVAVVAMTSSDATDSHQHFDWTPAEKSTVLGSFLWGYMATQVAGGTVATRWRASLLCALSISVSGAITALLPLAAAGGGVPAVAAIRVLTGLIQGAMYPSIYTLIGRWVPPDERSRAGALLLGSQPLGNIFALGLSGWLASAWGWPAIFYVFGVAGVAMGALFFLVSADSPDAHPRISAAERDYICESLAAGTKPPSGLAVPWGRILTSVAVWSAVASVAGELWGYWVLLACSPSYLNNLLRVGIEWNGLISATPQAGMLLGAFVFGWLGDLVEARKLLPFSINRKVFNSIGMWGSGVACVLAGLLGPAQPALAVALLVVWGFLMSATYCGAFINYVDLAPNFSGILFSMGNMVGSFISAFAPYTESIFVDRKDPMPGWSNVFYMTAVVYLVLNLQWLVWGTAEVQPWNWPAAGPERPERPQPCDRELAAAKRAALHNGDSVGQSGRSS